MGFLVFLGIVVVVVVISLFVAGYNADFENYEINKKAYQEILDSVESHDAILESEDKHNITIIDKVNNELHVVVAKEKVKFELYPIEYKHRIIDLNDIMESELLIDDETITKSSRGSQVGGAVAGGALFGGVGAIIGGLSGKQTSKKEVSKIDLKLTINDFSDPVCRIELLPLNKTATERVIRYKADSPELIKGLEEAEKWHALMQIIMSDNKNQEQNV